MARIECTHEADVLTMVYTGRWPERAPDDLRAHVAACGVCADLAVTSQAIESVHAERFAPSLPSAGTMWWRAQIRAKQDAARQVVRPITAVQAMALAAIVGVAGAVFGATAGWFQRALQAVSHVVTGATESVRLPSMPHDLSTIPSGYWVVFVVVVFSLVAGAAVVGWAMKEE